MFPALSFLFCYDSKTSLKIRFINFFKKSFQLGRGIQLIGPHGTTTSARQIKTNLKTRKKFKKECLKSDMKNSRNQHCSVKKECKVIKFLGVANNEEHRPTFLILNVQSTCSNQQYVKEIPDLHLYRYCCHQHKMLQS